MAHGLLVENPSAHSMVIRLNRVQCYFCSKVSCGHSLISPSEVTQATYFGGKITDIILNYFLSCCLVWNYECIEHQGRSTGFTALYPK